MGKVSISRTPLPMTYERHTQAHIDPSVSIKDVAAALLDPSEFEASCRIQRKLMVKGHNVGNHSAEAEREILSCIKPESLENGDVVQTESRVFKGGEALKRIERKYGLSRLHLSGTKEHVTGFLISSYVTYAEPDGHVKRYANILRSLKQRFPPSKYKFVFERCQSTAECDPKLTKMLQDLMIEKHPMQPRKGEED